MISIGDTLFTKVNARTWVQTTITRRRETSVICAIKRALVVGKYNMEDINRHAIVPIVRSSRFISSTDNNYTSYIHCKR